MRILLIVSSMLLFLFASTQRPGSHFTANIPINDRLTGVLSLTHGLAFLLFAVGGIVSKRRRRTAIGLLSIGIVLRCFVELFASMGKSLFRDGSLGAIETAVLVAGYALSFVLPVLFLWDLVKAARMANQAGTPAADATSIR